MDDKDTTRLAKKFPAYFENFKIPLTAKAQVIDVYRACKTHKIERASFLNSFEENGFKTMLGASENDPAQYSLSMYTKLKDVARFVKIDSRYQPPFALAKGTTTTEDGICCKTKEWKPDCRNSHVDWWLYENATPWRSFELKNYEDEKAVISKSIK